MDLPFGKGKLLGHNSGRLVDSLIGGWQIAGFAVVQPLLPAPTGNITNYSPIKYNGKNVPIRTVARCLLQRLASLERLHSGRTGINSVDPRTASRTASWAFPAITYRSPRRCFPPATAATQRSEFPVLRDKHGVRAVGRTEQCSGPPWAVVDPMQNQFMLGPMQWNMSASAFKTVKFNERTFLRINVDFSTTCLTCLAVSSATVGDGVITTKNSANSPRARVD